MSYTFHFISDEDARQTMVGNPRGFNSNMKKTIDVTFEQLKEEFIDFMKAVDSLFDIQTLKGNGGLIMDEIELNLSISAEGKISVLSSVTGGVSANSGIKIKLKRKE